MLPNNLQWVVEEFEPEGDPLLLYQIAGDLERAGNLEGAATVYDRAFGLDPQAADVCAGRQRVLDQLAVTEHGLVFRYVPAGPFLMGSLTGEPDERPWRPVWLSAYWLAETPVSYAAYQRLTEAPAARPRPARRRFDRQQFVDGLAMRIQYHYCFDREAADSGGPGGDEERPVVAVSWSQARALGERLSTRAVRYGLPTEAQWEKAARGGLIGARHAWGDEPPTADRCDFDRFATFSIQPMKTYPPNGYGLYAMNGGVWEWARDWYDRDYYRESPAQDPGGPAKGQEKVLRGGCWADCADVVTVSFRASRAIGNRDRDHLTANFGIRLCRTAG
jgi:formylglycine-generating enzyme required for sulfatase activity